MTRIERSMEIRRPPDEVFEVLRDASSLARWVTILVETRDAPRQPIEPGDSFEQTVRILGAQLDSRWKVDGIRAPSEIRYEATVVVELPVSMVQRVRSSEGGSTVDLEVDYELPGGLVGDVLDRAFVKRRTQRDADRSLRRLKHLLED